MTIKPSDYIYKEIIQDCINEAHATLKYGVELTLETAESIFMSPDEYLNGEDLEDIFSNFESELRHFGEEIDLPPKTWSRHYEVDCVAYQFDDVWITWDYYYGGGKHGEPEQFDWIGKAEFLNLDEEKEVVTIVRTFSRKEGA